MKKNWNSFLNGIMMMPGAKIDRESFIRKTFHNLSEDELRICLEDSPTKVVSLSEIERIASSVIRLHTTTATTLSAITGIPGGLAIIAMIPADVANYYYHVVKVGQKLGYLYGFPDMIDENGELTPDGEVTLTAFIGVMNNVEIANNLINKIASEMAKRMSEETAVRVAGNVLSKQIAAQAVETIATKLGAQITAKSASRGISKVIPLMSGLICGGITYATFKPQAKRLHEALRINSFKEKDSTLKTYNYDN